MKKWKYKIELIYPSYQEVLKKKLNELGKYGWEAFKIDNKNNSIIIYFKKEIIIK